MNVREGGARRIIELVRRILSGLTPPRRLTTERWGLVIASLGVVVSAWAGVPDWVGLLNQNPKPPAATAAPFQDR
ncbi:hypothetical protein ACFW9N_43810 [Streptomyces sp. NPDC059496]|uniref:hypothetical protein n=1 Tax=Streptomyces sp. NPDC059496 TaxID=3346851 RepID=UPI0036A925FC